VEKFNKEILEKKVMSKSISLWLKGDGSTAEKVNDDPKTQTLTDEQILMVAELAAKCEVHYGKPMDIEWAMEGGELYLLQ
jgi:pyruvate,water dikinase